MPPIPVVFDQPDARFVLIRAGQKFPPVDQAWQLPENAHNFQEAAAWKGNVGVQAGYGGFIGLDQDKPAAFTGLELPPSTKWETRPGRLGMRFKVEEEDLGPILTKYNRPPDQAQLKLFKDGEAVGEVKLQRSYQVIPPSWKAVDGQRVAYKMVEEVHPATISLSWLLGELQRVGITFSEKPQLRAENNVAKLEEIRQTALTSKRDRTAKAREFLNEALLSTGGKPGSRNNTGLWLACQLRDLGLDPGQASEFMIEYARALEAARADGDEPYSREEALVNLQQAYNRPARDPPTRVRQPEPTTTNPEIDDKARDKALEILKTGDPMAHLVDSCGRLVLGAEKAFKKLVCCVAVQDIRQSAGLHPKLNGESGTGKTAAVLAFAHHLPPEAVIKGSTSNLAAFYHKDGDRRVRILDDYAAGNETLDTIIKQTSSVFHQRYIHRTVKRQEPLTLEIGSEQTWIITSVDSSQDVQVLNRQLPINVDDSIELTRAVNQQTIARYGVGGEQFPEDDQVATCRAIWQILREERPINVRVHFWDRIEWLDTSNRRNPSLFMDILIAHTALCRFQREKDPDGYYLASEADFEAAKALFVDKNDAEELVHRLTRKEREFAELLVHHPEGLPREEVAQALNVSINRVSQLANGEKGKGGLSQKLSGFDVVDVTDSVRIDDTRGRSVRRQLYRLTGFNHLAGFDAVVRLHPKPQPEATVRMSKDTVRMRVRKSESKEIDSREREKEREEIESKDSKEKLRERPGQPKVTGKTSLSLLDPEKPYFPYSEALDSDSKPYPILTHPYSDSPDSGDVSLPMSEPEESEDPTSKPSTEPPDDEALRLELARRDRPSKPKDPDLEDFKAKVTQHNAETCARCGQLITGPTGRGGRGGLCLDCWADDHPREEATG